MLTKSLKRTGSVVAAAALVVAGASAASAASETVYVPYDDIGEYGGDYEGWHQEHPDGDDSIEWSEDPEGVLLGSNGPAQLLNGLVGTGEKGEEAPAADLVENIAGASYDANGDVVSFQVGIWYGEDLDE